MLQQIRYVLSYPFLLLYYFAYRSNKNRNIIDEDLRRWNLIKRQSRNILLTLFVDETFRNLFYHRVRLPFLRNILPPSPLYIISPWTKIGKGCVCIHPTGTFINAKSIGENFCVRQNTTIGNKSDGRNDLIPRIGNNVTVGANVCIIGDISIGDNVIIGAGSVVVKSIPDNSVVAGNPAIIIKRIF